MNFTDVVNEVISITKRPDKISDIRRSVNAAINFCCIDTDFARDRQNQTVTLDGTLYAQSIALNLFTRFRKVDAMRPLGRKLYLSLTEPSDIFGNCIEKLNTYYIAGDNIILKLEVLETSLLVSYYSYPPVLTDAAPTFWMLDMNPYMIIDKAAAKIFKNIGDDTSARAHEEEFKRAYLAFVSDNAYGSNA